MRRAGKVREGGERTRGFRGERVAKRNGTTMTTRYRRKRARV